MIVTCGKNDSAQKNRRGYSKPNVFMVVFIFVLISPRCSAIFVFPQTGGSNTTSLYYRGRGRGRGPCGGGGGGKSGFNVTKICIHFG